MLIIPRKKYNIGIEPIRGAQLTGAELDRDIAQLSHFTVWIQDYYEQTLDLERVDTDPRPGYVAELIERMGRVRRAGILAEDDAREVIVARRLTADGAVSESASAIRGLLVLLKPESGVLEIDEIDSQEKGLGRILLRQAVERANPDGIITLDVAEPNPVRETFYRPHGFTETGRSFHHGVFDVRHIQMAAPTSVVAAHLTDVPV